MGKLATIKSSSVPVTYLNSENLWLFVAVEHTMEDNHIACGSAALGIATEREILQKRRVQNETMGSIGAHDEASFTLNCLLATRLLLCVKYLGLGSFLVSSVDFVVFVVTVNDGGIVFRFFGRKRSRVALSDRNVEFENTDSAFLPLLVLVREDLGTRVEDGGFTLLASFGCYKLAPDLTR